MVGRLKKSFTRIPETLTEVVRFLFELGARQRAINELKREAKAKIAVINAELTTKVDPIRKERDTIFNALFAFAAPRKALLTEAARSVVLPSGTFGWRWTPPAVVGVGGLTDREVIARLERRGLHAYVRVVKEVDREALLRDKPNLSFIQYEQREEFFAKPKLEKGEGSTEELTTEAIDV